MCQGACILVSRAVEIPCAFMASRLGGKLTARQGNAAARIFVIGPVLEYLPHDLLHCHLSAGEHQRPGKAAAGTGPAAGAEGAVITEPPIFNAPGP